MNKISGQLDKSDYEIYDDFINFRIDNYWLDEKIDEIYPGQSYKGLIPTLDFGLYNENEKQIVWDRILPEKGEVAICPILMCPDDNDFSCTLIIAEIENYGDFVQWKRIGLDETRNRYEDRFGKTIKWFDNFGTLNFETKDYLDTIDSFKQQLTKDKVKYERTTQNILHALHFDLKERRSKLKQQRTKRVAFIERHAVYSNVGGKPLKKIRHTKQVD